MRGGWRIGELAALGLIALAGCAPFRRAPLPDETAPHANRAARSVGNEREASDPGQARSGDPAARAKQQTPSSSDPAAMSQVLIELDALAEVDPEAAAQLREDLANTDPLLWPQLSRLFRASIERRRSAARQIGGDGARADSIAGDEGPAVQAVGSSATARGEDRPIVRTAAETRPSDAAAAEQVNEPSTADADTTSKTAAPDAAATGSAASGSAATEITEGTEGERERGVDSAASVPPTEIVTTELVDAGTPQRTLPTVAGTPQRASPTEVEAASGSDATGINPAARFEEATVTNAAAGNPSDLSWRQHLAQAIESLERERGESPKNLSEISDHAHLRMLYLAAGRREEAVKAIPGIPAAQQDFWSKELFGLSRLLDDSTETDPRQRAAEAGIHLAEARARLGETALLVVKNPAFCTKVSSYGVISKFDSDTFQPGQEVLLYAEVENFKSEPDGDGYRTALKSGYQILDASGNRVDERQFPTSEERCAHPRRDFFTRYYIRMPERIYDGVYTLKLTMEDTLTQNVGETSIEFTIAGAAQ